MSRGDIWETCIREAFKDAGIKATKDQVETVVCWVDGQDENMSLSTGSHAIPSPASLEVARLERELKEERSKVDCKVCQGKGSITTYGGTRSATSRCWGCGGEGRVSR